MFYELIEKWLIFLCILSSNFDNSLIKGWLVWSDSFRRANAYSVFVCVRLTKSQAIDDRYIWTLWLRSFLNSPWAKLYYSWHETASYRPSVQLIQVVLNIWEILYSLTYLPKCSHLRVNSNVIPFGKLCWAQQVKINCSCYGIISTWKHCNDSWSEKHYLFLPLRIVLDYIKYARGPNNAPTKVFRIWWMKLQHMK